MILFPTSKYVTKVNNAFKKISHTTMVPQKQRNAPQTYWCFGITTHHYALIW